MTINYPNYPQYYYPDVATSTPPLPPVARPTDPKLLEVLERIADALEELAY